METSGTIRRFIAELGKTAVTYLKAAADMLLPRTCIVCGKKLQIEEDFLCPHCLEDMPLTYYWERSHNPMADRFNETARDEKRYVYACALFFFDSEAEYRRIPYSIKYEGNVKAGRFFGTMLGTRIASGECFDDIDTVIPVPLHPLRRWKRGYNQAEIIASSVSECLGAELRTDILFRSRHTKTQTKLSIKEKGSNVSGAFDVRNTSDTAPRHILLIDDVFTTGSTALACLTALRKVFPPEVRISVATLGFVGRA